MSSKFLERLDEIREAAPPRMGFGQTRAAKTPGMALIIDIGDKVAEKLELVIKPPADAIIMESRYRKAVPGADAEAANFTKKIIGDSPISWGTRVKSLSATNAREWRNAGADLIVFSMEKTDLDAITSDDAARILSLTGNESPEDLRDINPLPVDAVMVDLPGNPADWKLQDLAAIARVSGRVGKHLLAEVSGPPNPGALEALRNAGVVGLVVSLSLGDTAIADLKDALLNMPRPGSNRRARTTPILPGSVYAARRPAPADDPDDDDD